MKGVVETMLEHPFASIFIIMALGHAVSVIVHGDTPKPIVLSVSKTEAKTEA